MELTENNTIPYKHWAGLDDWSRNYMYGRNTKGSIDWAWESGKYGSGRLFGQRLLSEVKWN